MQGKRVIITTSHTGSPEQSIVAREFASRLNLPFARRNGLSVAALCSAHGANGAVVVSSGRISFVSGEQEFYFHPGLAILRIKELKNGNNDKMIEAMCLNHGLRILDCTLGLGTDAIVASFVTGPEGRVVGLEKSILLSAIVSYGLSHYQTGEEDIDLAMRRIEVITVDHREYLAGLSPGSFDIIYFDPMFRRPRHRSAAINAMRGLAAPDPLDCETVESASRIATRRVVVKETRGGGEHSRLGLSVTTGGKYSPVVYGVLGGRGGSCR